MSPAFAVPNLHLDELLRQLQAYVGAALAVRDRINRLLDSVVQVGSGLDLSATLDRILDAAVELSDARRGALGVYNPASGGFERFVSRGIDERTAREIAAQQPTGAELPVGGARALCVPLPMRSGEDGRLFLADKQGDGLFDETDESIVNALASAAGVAIDNAHLYELTRLGVASREASADVARALLSGAASTEVLGIVAAHARRLCGAVQAFLMVREDNGPWLRVAAGDGVDTPALHGVAIPIDGSGAGAVFRSGVAEAWTGQKAPTPWLTDRVDVGPRLLVPLGGPGQVRGVLNVYQRSGAPPFARALLGVLSAFAGQAAVAIELGEQRQEIDRLSVYADRERIARDLHDLVIQRLFATGMSIDGVLRTLPESPERPRSVLNRAVEDIDATIRQIRATIYALQAPTSEGDTVRSRILRVAADARTAIGFSPSLHVDAAVDDVVSPAVEEHLLATLREALSNVARHAAARSVQVQVRVVVGEQVELTVRDDGVGPGELSRRSGLANLQARAEQLGGGLSVTDAGPGTLLRWWVPVSYVPEPVGASAAG